MFIDYYQVLGIPRNATLEQIHHAYRIAALRHHPDRGGDTETMRLVNEAFSVLRDSVLRAGYDAVLDPATSEAVRNEWSSCTEQVRERSHDFPLDWATFEKWVNSFTADMKSAKYDHWLIGETWKIPIVKNSLSGAVFVATGILVIVFYLWWSGFYSVTGDNYWITIFVVTFFGSIVGAWLGQVAHLVLRGLMLKSTETEEVRCVHCQKSLRVPRLNNEIVVTCPKCKARFSHRSSLMGRLDKGSVRTVLFGTPIVLILIPFFFVGKWYYTKQMEVQIQNNVDEMTRDLLDELADLPAGSLNPDTYPRDKDTQDSLEKSCVYLVILYGMNDHNQYARRELAGYIVREIACMETSRQNRWLENNKMWPQITRDLSSRQLEQLEEMRNKRRVR